MSRWMRLSVVLLVLAALVGIMPVAAQSSNTLIFARSADAVGLDPHAQPAFSSLRLLELIYEPLVIFDANLNLQPELAESWEFNADATQLTMHLRQGVTFHDGSAFDSTDVKDSFTRILDENTKDAARSNFLSITSMDTPDANTIVFNLSQPDVPLLTAMASINAAIVSSESIAGNTVATDANGTGPYVLKEWKVDDHTSLTANANWWGGKPEVDGIEIRIIPDETSIVAALRAGTVDFALLLDPTAALLLDNDSSITLNRTPSLSYHVLQLNASHAPLDKLEVRQAIACAIDRQQVVDTAALGEGTVTGPLTIPAFALPTDQLFCYTRDVDKAKALLAQAGMADGFTLKMLADTQEPPTSVAEAQNIQSQLADVGITVEIESLEHSVYVDRWLKADFDSAVALNGGRPDPYTMYSRYFTSTGNLNKVAGYSDATLDQELADGRVETDQVKRKAIFDEFQKHITEVAPWVWLYQSPDYTAQQAWVSGFVPNSTDSLYSLAHVKLAAH